MAKENINIDVSVIGMDKVETLILLLGKYKDSLPIELADSLIDLADCDHCEIGSKYIAAAGYGNDVQCFVDGKLSNGVVSANAILKRVKIYPSRYYGGSKYPDVTEAGDAFEEIYIYPKSLLIKSGGGETIISWGC